MAEGHTSSSRDHWLFATAHEIFHRANQARKDGEECTNITVQVFLFHGRNVLMVQPRGTSSWTAPWIDVDSDEKEEKLDRTICGMALERLQNAVEEGALPDLQFLNVIKEDPPVEQLGPRLHFNLLLTTAAPKLDENSLLYFHAPHNDFRWVGQSDTMPQPFANLTPNRIFAFLQAFKDFRSKVEPMHSNQRHDELLPFYCNFLRACIKTREIVLGDSIKYAFIAIRSGQPASSLCLICTTREMIQEAKQHDHWKISNMFAKQNPDIETQSSFQTLTYDIVGIVSGDKITITDAVGNVGLLQQNNRIAVEWIQDTPLTRVVL